MRDGGSGECIAIGGCGGHKGHSPRARGSSAQESGGVQGRWHRGFGRRREGRGVLR